MQGPLVEGRGSRPRNAWRARRRLQCRALSSRAGAQARCPATPRRRRRFNAGPSRRGPGHPVGRRRSPRPAPASMQGPLVEGRGAERRRADRANRSLQCRALSSRAGARHHGRLADDLPGASMRGPLVEGRGPTDSPSPRRPPRCFNAGPSRRGPGPRRPRRSSWRRGRRFNAGPSRRGPGLARIAGLTPALDTALQCGALSSRAGALSPVRNRNPRRHASMWGPLVEGRGIVAAGGVSRPTVTLQCGALSSRAGARMRRDRAPSTSPGFNAGPSRRGPGPDRQPPSASGD